MLFSKSQTMQMYLGHMLIVWLVGVVIHFTQADQLLQRSYDTYGDGGQEPELHDKWHYHNSLSLVKSFRTLDALGSMYQYPNGYIDSSDFGQNIDNLREGAIKPGEKQRKLEKLKKEALKRVLELLEEQLKKKLKSKKKKAAKLLPLIILKMKM